ncbi:hypothetical protein V6Z12_D03G002600 [Gossypium hirsutum]
MGGFFHFFEFNHSNMARKILAHKRHVGGLEAPRNSLELQLENSQNYCAVDDLPCSYEVEEDWAAKNYCRTEASMKKLINEEMSKQSNTRQNTPSIVARLMGMDALPLDSKPIVVPSRDGAPAQEFGKPRPCEHPQEEELQKFKKEFEAWQAARLRECSKVVDVGSISMAQEKLSKEKMAHYSGSERAKHEKPLESKRFAVKENMYEMGLHRRHKSEPFTAEQKESRSRCTNKDFQLPSMIHYNEKVDAAPTRIVILKPGKWNRNPFNEKPSDPRQIAKHIAEQVRENVSKDLKMNLVRSESTKSYRSSVQFNGPGSQSSSTKIQEHSYEQEMQTRSFRHGDDLLLEDRHILTGAQIRRKHEGIENVQVDVEKRKREKFNLKEKVSNIKYGLTLRRRLFGRKIQSMVDTYGAYDGPVKDILSGTNSYKLQREALDYPSPISTHDVTLGEENAVQQVFKEISSNLNELRRQLNELESDGVDDISIEKESTESEMGDIEDQAEGYVRDLLVASGLYGGSCDKSLSRWDLLAKPIGDAVFEQVEESYRKSGKENDENDKKVDRKVLLDLLNEALSTILGPPVTLSRFRRKLVGSSILPPPRGRKLLNSVCYYSLDSMVARDLGSTPWSSLMDEETNVW